jgi:hypothetical protein
MKLHEDKKTGFKWFDNIEDVKPEYFPVKAVSVLQFYTLKGRTSTINKTNIEPYRYLQYVVFSPQENRYYMKLFRVSPLDVLYFYRKNDTFSGEDEAVNNLRNYVEDRNVFLLFTQEQVSDTTTLLQRLYKANLSGEGKVPYKTYIELMGLYLDLEDYRNFGRELTGTKTVQKQYEDKISALWKEIHELNNIKP